MLGERLAFDDLLDRKLWLTSSNIYAGLRRCWAIGGLEAKRFFGELDACVVFFFLALLVLLALASFARGFYAEFVEPFAKIFDNFPTFLGDGVALKFAGEMALLLFFEVDLVSIFRLSS